MLTKITKLMGPEDDKGGGGDDLEAKIAAAVAAALPKALNGAITSHLNRVTAKFEERFKAIEKPPGGEGGEGEDGGEVPPKPVVKGAPGASGLSLEVEQRILRAEKRAEKLEREVKEEREKRAAEETKRLTNEERGALSKLLGEKKVSPEMIDAALAMLHTEQKRVARGEDGKLSWRGDDDDHVGLGEGVDAFLKTPTGQRFLAPTGSQGGGGSGPGAKPRAGGGADALAGESLMSLLTRSPGSSQG
jgi:hypothetical protein